MLQHALVTPAHERNARYHSEFVYTASQPGFRILKKWIIAVVFCSFPTFSCESKDRFEKQRCRNESRERQLYDGTGPSFKLPIDFENGYFEVDLLILK